MKITKTSQGHINIHFSDKEAERYFDQVDEAFDELKRATESDYDLFDYSVISSLFNGLHAVLHHEEEEYDVELKVE